MATEERSTLQLNLHREFFGQIVEGKKPKEYRDRSPHWDSRLDGRSYEIVCFKNGYGPDVPEMEVEFLGVEKTRTQYVIRLGKIISLKNWPPK